MSKLRLGVERIVRAISWSAPSWLSLSCAWLAGAAVILVSTPLTNVQDPRRVHADSRLEVADWLRVHAGPTCTLLVPRKLGLAPYTLPERCKLLMLDDLERDLPKRVAEARASRGRFGRVLLVSADWSYDERLLSGKRTADRWSAAVAALPKVRRFQAGERAIQVNYWMLQSGDPSLAIYELRL